MTFSGEILSPLMLRTLRWVAVPMPEVVTRDIETRILVAARKRHIDKMSVVCTGPILLSNEPCPQDYVYELDLTNVNSADFFMPPSHPFLYFPKRDKRYPDENDFALIFGDEGEFYTIAGSKTFVEEVLQNSVEKARLDFQDWVDHEDSEKFGSYLRDLADRYASLDKP